jgi:hypothetical protein
MWGYENKTGWFAEGNSSSQTDADEEFHKNLGDLGKPVSVSSRKCSLS